MSLEGSPLRSDILDITANKPRRAIGLIIDLHTHYGKMLIDDIVSLDIIRDYVANYGDTLILKTRMFLGEYVKYILDSKDLMEADIVWKHQQGEFHRRYRATLQLDANKSLHADHFSQSSIKNLNRETLIEVTLELVDIEIEPLMIVKVDPGVYKGDGKALMKTLISRSLSKVKVNDITPIDFISVADPNINIKLDEVVVKSNTLLQALPDYINNVLGFYSSGIGTYVQRSIYDNKDLMGFYCYPLYNTYRFREKIKKLAIVVENSIEADLIKTTWYRDEDTIRLIGTNITTDHDERSSTDTKTYAGVVDSQETFNKDRESNESVKIDKKKLTHAFSHQDRKDGVTVVHNRQSTRHKTTTEVMGELSSNFGQNQVYKWSNSDPHTLYPGMPVAVLVAGMNGPTSRTGVLVGNHSVYTPINTPSGGVVFVCTTVLAVKLNVKSET